MLPRNLSLMLAFALFISVSCGDAVPSGSVEGVGASSTAPGSGIAMSERSGCAVGQQECGGLCTSVDTVATCGACGVACNTGQSCSGGTCQCDGELSACEDGCVDVLADAKNCGGCGVACGEDELCSAGVCVPSSQGCPLGLEECSGACVDIGSSQFHCGSCETACAAGQACSSGSCDCTIGVLCGATCTNTMTDVQNCGACSNACAVGESCEDGQCVAGEVGSGGESATGGADGGGGPSGSVVILEEGETGQCHVDGVVESSNAGFSGVGYLNTENSLGAGIEWVIDVEQAGLVSLEFAYANGGADDRPANLLVGAMNVAPGLSFPSTGSWTSWSVASVQVMMAAGENRIVLEATGASGLSNIDHLALSGASVSASDCGGDGSGGSMGSGGGSASGGDTASGGAPSGGEGLADDYPCDGPTDVYDYVVDGTGNNHSVNGTGSYSYEDAILTALGNGNRSVLVLSSGDVSSATQVRIFSNTVFNVCGTINVTDNGGSGDRAPAYARGATGIQIPHFNLTGLASYGMFFREVSDLHLGEIHINGSGGIGIRIDNNPSSNCWGRCNQVTNVQIDDVYVSNTGGHGVETYGVDGLVIGSVTARNVTNAGLLLNATINASVGVVDGEDVATGNGYATFRVANEAGKIGDTWPEGNIHVGTIRARRGGRGIFCVSDSGGTTIDNVDIADTGNNSMLLENCHSFRVATNSGTVDGGGAIIITQRADEHTPSSNVTIQNLNASGITIDGRCGGTENLICNITGNANVTGCSGVVQTNCP